MEKSFIVSAFFESEKKTHDTLVRLLEAAVPRDLIEVVVADQFDKDFYQGARKARLSRTVANAGRGALLGLIVFSFFSLLLIASAGARENRQLIFIMLLGPNIGVLSGAFFGMLWSFVAVPRVPARYQRASEQKGILLLVRAKEQSQAEGLLGLLESQGGAKGKVEAV
jgi:hypothetical protein